MRLTTVVKGFFYNSGSNILSKRQLDTVKESLNLLTHFELGVPVPGLFKDQRLTQCVFTNAFCVSSFKRQAHPH